MCVLKSATRDYHRFKTITYVQLLLNEVFGYHHCLQKHALDAIIEATKLRA